MFGYLKSLFAGEDVSKKRKQPERNLEDEEPALLSPIPLTGQRSSKRQKMAEDHVNPPSKIDFGADPDPASNSSDVNLNGFGLSVIASNNHQASETRAGASASPPKPLISADHTSNSITSIPPLKPAEAQQSFSVSSFPHYRSPLAGRRVIPGLEASIGNSPIFGGSIRSLSSPESRIANSPYMNSKRSAPRSPQMVDLMEYVEEKLAYEELLDKLAPLPATVILQQQQEKYRLAQLEQRDDEINDDDVVLVEPTEADLRARAQVAADAAHRGATWHLRGVDVDESEYEYQQESRALIEEIAARKAAIEAKYADYLDPDQLVSSKQFGSVSPRSVSTTSNAPFFIPVVQSRIEIEASRKESLQALRERAAAVAKENEEIAKEYDRKLEKERLAALRKNVSMRRRLSEFTPEEDELVNKSIDGPSHSVVLTHFSIDMKVEDLRRLKPGQWLNDEVINYYMELLNERAKQTGVKLHCFSSMFYALLSEKGFSYHRVQRWTRRFDVFSMERIVIPIHLGNHWCLAVINFAEKKFEYYDSLGAENPKCLERLRMWVKEESKDKKKVDFDLSEFVDEFSGNRCPQQQNGYDCGVFACKFGEFRARNAPFDFTQEDMPYFRKRMWLEILNKKLHDDYQ